VKTSVYLLWHTHEEESSAEDVKLIGVYSSEERAKEALEQVRGQPGFRDYPDGFEIDENVLDITGWGGGFSKPLDPDEVETK
jgi:hypothetical protein